MASQYPLLPFDHIDGPGQPQKGHAVPPYETAYLGAASPDISGTSSLRGKHEIRSDVRPVLSRSSSTRLRIWSWEILTWIAGVLAFATIVILMIRFKNASTREWHSEIQISTIVAALAQFVQSALLVSLAVCIGQLKWSWLRNERPLTDLEVFDDASRGPQGSLMLLLSVLPRWARRQRSRSPIGQAGYAPASTADGNFSHAREASGETAPYQRDVGALLLGIFAASSIILMLAFPTFVQQALSTELREIEMRNSLPSVGRAINYTGTAQQSPDFFREGPVVRAGQPESGVDIDASAAVSRGLTIDLNPSDVPSTCTSAHCEWKPFRTLAFCSSFEDITSSIDRMSIRPNSVNVTLKGQETLYSSVGNTPGLTLFTNTARVRVSDDWLSPVAETLLFYVPQCGAPDDVDYSKKQSSWKAYKGSWNLCLQTIEVSFRNSSLNASITREERDLQWTQKDRSRCATVDGEDDEYCFGTVEYEQINYSLSDLLNTTASFFKGGDNYYYTAWSPFIVRDVLGLDPTLCNDNDPTKGFAGFKARVENIGLSLSNFLRTANSSSPIDGIAYETDQIIVIDLRWLIFPAYLVVTITVILIATILRAKDGSTPTWKYSPLPVLRSVDPSLAHPSLHDIRDDAKRVMVHLKDGGDGYYLKERAL